MPNLELNIIESKFGSWATWYVLVVVSHSSAMHEAELKPASPKLATRFVCLFVWQGVCPCLALTRLHFAVCELGTQKVLKIPFERDYPEF
jgi:hypothetical protein